MNALYRIFLSLSLLFLFFSCKKDHNILGVEVQPGEDELNASYVGDLPVTGHSLPYDSIASFNDTWKYLGNNVDPHFGRTNVGLYVNTSISTTDNNYEDAKIVDAELIFVLYNDYIGDKTANLTYSVFPLDSSLTYGRVYFTTNSRLHNNTKISEYTCTSTTMVIPGSSSSDPVPVLRIKIDTAYASALLHDTQNLKDNDTYQAKYKGYYISSSIADNSEGTLFQANLDHFYSGLHLHYTRASIPQDSTPEVILKFSGSNKVRYNTVKFDYSQNLKSQFLDSSLGSNNLFLQGLGNTKLKLQIPFLKNYSDSFQISVNRAELILNVDPLFTSSGSYIKPPQLTLLSIDTLSRETFVQDLLSNTDYVRYNGFYDEDNNRYVFNIAREAQLIFRGQKKNRGFYLVVANTDLSLKTVYLTDGKDLLSVRRDNYYERVVLAGSAHPTLKPKFNLHYIKFKND